MDQYVTYNEDFHVLICRQHKFEISPDWIEHHFRQFHNTIPLATRQEITQYVKSLNLWPPQHILVKFHYRFTSDKGINALGLSGMIF